MNQENVTTIIKNWRNYVDAHATQAGENSFSLFNFESRLPADRFDISNLKPGSVVVSVNPKYYRPTEVDLLIGDATKAKETFGWEAKTKWDELASMMAKEDFKKVLKRGF